MDEKIILDLCGGTGSWSMPYKEAGYDVRLIDLPTDIRLLEVEDIKVHGILCAPPCRCFSYAGNAMKKSMTEMIDALSVVDACLRAVRIYRPNFWALENPTGSLVKYLGAPAYIFHPWHFEGNSSKRTLLWGDFNPPVRKVFTKPGSTKSTGNIGRSGDYRRAITPQGFAKAFFEVNK
jgi:hypothetical protein